MNKSEKKKLYDLCLNVEAHCVLDCEVTLAGNGINCSEAAGVTNALMKEFNIELDQKDVDEKVKQLEEWYGY